MTFERFMTFCDEGILGFAGLAFFLLVVVPMLPFIALGWLFSRARAALALQSASPRPTGDVAEAVRRCRSVIAQYHNDTAFERGDFNLDDIECLIGALRTPDPQRDALVEREVIDDIGEMMSEFVDNWPEPKRIKTALALIAKTMRAGLDPPKHKYWGAGEPDCPVDIKAGNGELHTLRCKVCGNEDARDTRCLAALATLQAADPVEPKVSGDEEAVARALMREAGGADADSWCSAKPWYGAARAAIDTLRASDPSRELVERAYYEGWRIGSQRALGQGPSNTAAQDWLDSDTLAALAQGQSDTKGEG